MILDENKNEKFSRGNDMKNCWISITAVIIIILITGFLYGKSTAVKSQSDYEFTLNALRAISPMIENFGDPAINDDFTNLKNSFQAATEAYYGLNYDESYEKYKSVKTGLIAILEKINQIYLNRTKDILDSISKESFEIMIKFHRSSAIAQSIRKPFDPLKDVKPIKEFEYNYFKDREAMNSYLRDGYKFYENALKLYNDPEIPFLKKRKNIPSESLNWVISQYLVSIYTCRQSKQNGIEFHKLKNKHLGIETLQKYGLSPNLISPVIDDRIPDVYKVDVIDNMKMIYSVELRKMGKNAGPGTTQP